MNPPAPKVHIEVPLQYWVGFFAIIFVFLAFDLFLHRKAHRIKKREALLWSSFWVGLAVAFNILVYVRWGKEAAQDFTAGYLIEEALSIDNLFVFVIIFRYFKVKPEYQHRILFWGILGAIVMRLAFVFLGAHLIERFAVMTYLLGGLLVLTGAKLMVQNENVDPEKNLALRVFRRFVRTTSEFEGPKFLVKRDGRTYATPLFLVLVVVESTDVVFAIDSVPAILAITTERFIVFTSNVFAILGLRSLYFLLSGMMDSFRYLKVGLSLILVFVGVKMLIKHFYEIDKAVSLGVIAGLLACSVAASVLRPGQRPQEPPRHDEEEA